MSGNESNKPAEVPPPQAPPKDEKESAQVAASTSSTTQPASASLDTTNAINPPSPTHEDAGRTTNSTALVPRTARLLVRTRSPASEQVGSSFLNLHPTTRRVAISVGKAGISIADGLLLSCNKILNPVISAAFVVYESAKVVQAYRHGDLNKLGYRTTKGDVALRIGKELTMMGVGVAIGQGIGALIGLSAIPVAGQLVVATLLSVGLGICVGTLVTHYVDRFTSRLQLRNQYGYPADEKGARRRFETLLERRHDLATMETCKIVQHYVDYRVACGWESVNDLDDYRASGDITRMPVSLQHFAVVQLQRKWGFVKERAQCRRIYRALLLVHHPDRGGSSELAAQLNKDFEFFALCQGWDSDCAALLQASAEDAQNAGASDPTVNAARRNRSNVVVDYLRTLFRQDTNSHVGANDLNQFGLLTLEAGTPADLHRLDVTASPNASFVGLRGVRRARDGASTDALEQTRTSLDDIESVSDEEEDANDTEDVTVAAAVRQRGVTRLLHSVRETYAATAEVITFSGLIHVSDDPPTWAQLHEDVSLYQRLQYSITMQTLELENEEAPQSGEKSEESVNPPVKHAYKGFRWSTVEEAVARREEVRRAIVAAVFTEETSQQLTFLLDLWRTAKSVAESYFRSCQQREAAGAAIAGYADEGKQTLDVLLRIHKQLDAAGVTAQKLWHGRLEDWANRTAPGFSSFMEDVKEVGLTASNALAAEYALQIVPSEKNQCLEYFKSWSRKQDTLRTLLSELRLAFAESRATAMTASTTATAPVPSTENANKEMDEYQTQLGLLHRQMAVVDVGVAEWASACAAHFPELAPSLREMPSTCLQAVAAPLPPSKACDGTAEGKKVRLSPRIAAFERERTLLHYTRLQPEPANRFDPFAAWAMPTDANADPLIPNTDLNQDEEFETVLTSFDRNARIANAVVSRDGVVGVTLMQAIYSDPLTGEITPCWLKRYAFSAVATVDTESAALELRRRARRILEEETVAADRCCSDLVVTARDVFYQCDGRELFVHYVRGATQQRFGSSNDVKRQVQPLGLRWIHDVLECVICLHTCQLAHGHIRLSSFTYDDFGNTALGLFFPAWDQANAAAHGAQAPTVTLAERQHCDVLDLGVMLMTEVLPLLPRSTAAAPQDSSATNDDAARVLEAVAGHLVGKEEPRWSLIDARQFVRRFLQLGLGELAVFAKQVVHPAAWAIRGPAPPVQLVAADPSHFSFTSLPHGATVRVYQNRHLALWETYWQCRRKMLTLRQGTYMLPPAVAHAAPPLFCSDDYEVRERYMWTACRDEEEAWERCQDGFRCLRRRAAPLASRDDMAAFSLDAPSASAASQWGVVCRVALGTTVENAEEEFEAAESLTDPNTTQYNKLRYAAARRSHFVWQTRHSSAPQVWVPCPWARCYPEYIVRISL